MWDPIVSVPDHCLSFYFVYRYMINNYISVCPEFLICINYKRLRLCCLKQTSSSAECLCYESVPYEPRHEKTCFSHMRTTKV